MTSRADEIDAATMRLKCIIGILRQLGGGSHAWPGIDTYLPDAFSVMGSDLQVIHDLLGDLPQRPAFASDEPLQALYDDFLVRSATLEATPEDARESLVDWFSEPCERARDICPTTARGWAAKILLMMAGGETLGPDGDLQALIDDARAVLGVDAEEAKAAA
ncbi:MAG: hypothetical protein AAGD13_01110 [Pseudomonadota bacterium]